jgi:hypothetical protein
MNAVADGSAAELAMGSVALPLSIGASAHAEACVARIIKAAVTRKIAVADTVARLCHAGIGIARDAHPAAIGCNLDFKPISYPPSSED